MQDIYQHLNQNDLYSNLEEMITNQSTETNTDHTDKEEKLSSLLYDLVAKCSERVNSAFQAFMKRGNSALSSIYRVSRELSNRIKNPLMYLAVVLANLPPIPQ